MREKITEASGRALMPELSGKEAARILANVFEACGVEPNKIPFEVLEKRVKERKGRFES